MKNEQQNDYQLQVDILSTKIVDETAKKMKRIENLLKRISLVQLKADRVIKRLEDRRHKVKMQLIFDQINSFHDGKDMCGGGAI